MPETLLDTFALVCGQTAGRTWAPGGEALPFCQRCAGIYLGAFTAIAFTLFLRSPPSPRRLLLDGACLLQMVPLGLHWIPHGAEIRTLSGGIFAVGLVDFLWLLPAARWGFANHKNAFARSWLRLTLTLTAVLGVLFAVTSRSPSTATVLAWAGLAGLAGLSGLAVVNLVLLIQWSFPVLLGALAWTRSKLIAREPKT